MQNVNIKYMNVKCINVNGRNDKQKLKRNKRIEA